MWFLGAGAPRSAGMPSAGDIIWDLKRHLYCTRENRDIADNELSNEAVREKIQDYLTGNGLQSPSFEEEYAHFFKLALGDDSAAHQKYLQGKLDPKKISLTSGFRILAALMEMSKARIVFTTNFDSVLENAYAFMTGKDLHAFSLDGSYAALAALNSESFPIYAKMHGDFRYYEIKNLPEQLRSNDKEIEKCFVNACSRYGLIVSGYSGRDQNVMDAFHQAISQNNAFPQGLFWMTSMSGNVLPSVENLIQKAKDKGINAHIVKVETFDSLMIKIWKLVQSKPQELNGKVRRSILRDVKVPRYNDDAQGYPIIRLNAFPVAIMPKTCAAIETMAPLSTTELTEKTKEIKSSAIFARERKIFAWGPLDEIYKIIPENEIKSCEEYDLSELLTDFNENGTINAFYTKAIVRAIVRDRPVRLRVSKGRYFVAISSKHEKYKDFEPILKDALKAYDRNKRAEVPAAQLAGKVPNMTDTYWMEGAELTLDYIDGKFWLAIRPDIWIEPRESRRSAKEFMARKKGNRYNRTQNRLLDAWKQILFGSEKVVTLQVYSQLEKYNATFQVHTTTAHSMKSKG